jgi:hypothetical protein
MSSTATVRSSSLSFLPLMTLASQKSKKRNFLVLQLYCQFIARVSIRSFFFPYLQASRALLEYFPSYVRTKYIASGLLAIFEYGTFVGRRARGGEESCSAWSHGNFNWISIQFQNGNYIPSSRSSSAKRTRVQINLEYVCVDF